MDWYNKQTAPSMTIDDWDSPDERTLQYLAASTPEFEEFNRILLVVHGHGTATEVVLPEHEGVAGYTLLWDSADEQPVDDGVDHEPGDTHHGAPAVDAAVPRPRRPLMARRTDASAGTPATVALAAPASRSPRTRTSTTRAPRPSGSRRPRSSDSTPSACSRRCSRGRRRASSSASCPWRQLDLKALAAAVGGKRAEMADPAVAERKTGYVVGGISPIGQKTALPTVLDETAILAETIFVWAGAAASTSSSRPTTSSP